MRPARIDAARVAGALKACAAALGAQWVYSAEEDIATYKDAYSPFVGEPELQLLPGGAVAPATVEEVQEVVRIANRYKVPLHPISTGRNLGYGGSAPTVSGSIVVDLKRMNRILEVNEEEAYVLLEPGVSFFELYRYFQEHDIKLMISTPEPGWGSPVGNALDHGVGGVAGDNFGQVNGLEVVLPTGELMRTGSGASSNSRLWQNYKYGFGPYVDGLFSQANLGIVTKMGFWMHRALGVQQGFTVVSGKSADIHPMLEATRVMRDQGVLYSSIGASPIRSSMNTAVGFTAHDIPEVRRLLARDNGGTAAEWEGLASEHKMPVSVALGQLRGPARVVAAGIEHAREVFSAIPGVQFIPGKPVTLPAKPEELDESDKGNFGIPNLYGFNRLTVQGPSHGHYYFSPLFKATSSELFAVNAHMRAVIKAEGDTDMLERFGWAGGLGNYPKAFIILLDFLVFDDVELNRRRRRLFERLVAACAEKGWTEYRTPVAFHDMIMATYSFNQHALLRFHEKIKDALDPNGILSPGKSGIWPKGMRGGRA
jgi:4-cresol dehydrogenase (hydroxylating)